MIRVVGTPRITEWRQIDDRGNCSVYTGFYKWLSQDEIQFTLYKDQVTGKIDIEPPVNNDKIVNLIKKTIFGD